MQQLVFELAVPEPPSFANFVVGRNAEALAAIESFAAGTTVETGMLLWGEPGSGKSHLLQAAVRAARDRGVAATFFAGAAEFAAADDATSAPSALVAIDDVDRLPPEGQARLFTLYNTIAARGARLLASSRQPLAALAIREDVRTRLGWGLVYEVTPLSDADKPAALADYARRRGFSLSDDVIAYLLAHGRRDMTAMCATLAALDRHSLSSKRPITIALLRELFQRELELPGTGM